MIITEDVETVLRRLLDENFIIVAAPNTYRVNHNNDWEILDMIAETVAMT